ncbi:hypothetical protein DY000_02017773 [Brassica cretica]|uniref:Uncharacterized protein n=1 Tax=Brassica cretica TaxID=69181 RepID=A0ABQ7CNA7_BRACR|nr:hypothetical protein DY000_02017773 [Brassica cretica]
MTTIKYKKSKREQSRSYSEFAFERYNKHRRVDENAWTNCRVDVSEELGRYVATELRLELGCYVATLFELLSDVSAFLRKAFRKEESIS